MLSSILILQGFKDILDLVISFCRLYRTVYNLFCLKLSFSTERILVPDIIYNCKFKKVLARVRLARTEGELSIMCLHSSDRLIIVKHMYSSYSTVPIDAAYVCTIYIRALLCTVLITLSICTSSMNVFMVLENNLMCNLIVQFKPNRKIINCR